MLTTGQGLSKEEAETKALAQMKRDAVSAQKPGDFTRTSTGSAKPCSWISGRSTSRKWHCCMLAACTEETCFSTFAALDVVGLSFEGCVAKQEMACDTGQDPPGVKPIGLREREKDQVHLGGHSRFVWTPVGGTTTTRWSLSAAREQFDLLSSDQLLS